MVQICMGILHAGRHGHTKKTNGDKRGHQIYGATIVMSRRAIKRRWRIALLHILLKGTNIKSGKPHVLLGDFNMRLGISSGDHFTNYHGKSLPPWIQEIGEGFQPCKQVENAHTFIRNGSMCSIPDQSWPMRACSCLLTRTMTWVAHRMIYTELQFSAVVHTRECSVVHKRFFFSKLEDGYSLAKYESRLTTLLHLIIEAAKMGWEL